MSPTDAELWHDTTILLAVAVAQGVALILGLGKLLVDSRTAKQQSKAAAEKAAEAADLSRPTGNGYADRTLGLLREILGRLDDTDERLDRLESRTERIDSRGERTAAAVERAFHQIARLGHTHNPGDPQ